MIVPILCPYYLKEHDDFNEAKDHMILEMLGTKMAIKHCHSPKCQNQCEWD